MQIFWNKNQLQANFCNEKCIIPLNLALFTSGYSTDEANDAQQLYATFGEIK